MNSARRPRACTPVVIAAFVCAACGDQPAGVSRPLAPEVVSIEIAENPENVLSAIVAVRARNAVSAAVQIHVTGSATDSDEITPAVPLVDGVGAIPVLGLFPERRYELRAIVYGAGGSTLSTAGSMTTRPLPADLPTYATSGDAPSPGFVVFGAGMYGVVINNSGRVVWYRRFSDGPGLNFMAEPSGHYVARPETSGGAPPHHWVELDPLGNETRTFSCAHHLEPRFHDLVEEVGGGYWIMCDDTRTMNLSAFGGVAAAAVTGTVVQHVGADGGLLFEWSVFDHFDIADLEPAALTGTAVNWTHGNALDVDASGKLLVSFRNLGEITKIDVPTGNVLWRMGGRRNEFTFFDTPTPAFARQHGMRAFGPRTLSILDNLGSPAESRAERYTVDEGARTARLVRSYGASPGVVALLGGSVQDAANGRTLVAYGPAGRLEEYDESGRVVWRIEGNAGYIFRAQRIGSLYAPGVGTAR